MRKIIGGAHIHSPKRPPTSTLMAHPAPESDVHAPEMMKEGKPLLRRQETSRLTSSMKSPTRMAFCWSSQPAKESKVEMTVSRRLIGSDILIASRSDL